MLSVIFGFITGLAGPISNTLNKLIDLQSQKATAKSNTEMKQIEQEMDKLQAQKALLLAEAGHRFVAGFNAVMRMILFGIPVGILMWKMYAWDKVWGSLKGCSGARGQAFAECQVFLTDPLTTQDWAVITSVLGFYLLHSYMNKR